jgi:hypothetical protein
MLLTELASVKNEVPSCRCSKIRGRWPTQAVLWLEWGCFTATYIPADAQFETAAHTFQPGLKYLLGYGGREQGTAMVAAERHEVSLPGRLESFHSPGHKASLRLRKSHSAKERLECGTGELELGIRSVCPTLSR